MASAPRDDDRVPGLVAKSDADNTPVVIEADAATKRLKVSAVITSGGSAGAQYTDGDATITHLIGTIPIYDKAGTITAVSVANPLPVSATIDTSAVATSANQTNKSQFTKITDGTDTALVTASGEMNVLATAQPGVDIGDVTVNNASGASAVNIQDGGNSITVDNGGTFAVQATLQTQTDTVMVGGVNIKEINGVTPLMGNGTTGTGSQRVTVASDNTPFAVKIDQTTPGTTNLVALAANQTVNLAQVGGTNTVNGGVAGSQSVGGTVATNVAITANPLNLGAQAVSSENSAVTTARQVQLVADLVGKLIVLPYANPENFVSGAATATDTTSTSLIAAPASGLRNYITQITVWNASAVNTYIKIQDGSGGTTLYTLPCPTVGGSVITLPTPLRQPTTATAIFFAANVSANAVFISASGYKGI